jgi:hypothetical protein
MKSLHKNVVQSRITIIFTNSRCTFLHRDDQWQNDKYKLLSIPGEGDIGIVYLAQQEEPVRYQASVKVIDPGMDSKRVSACLSSWEQAQESRIKLPQTEAERE